jgi:type IV pilus assembly protein PilW
MGWKWRDLAVKNEKGFTLIELMITLVISTIIMSAVVAVNKSQQATYVAQDQVAELQQNLRGAMTLLISDIRMAGFDPLGTANAANADLAITFATSGRFIFTVDSDGDGAQIIDGGLAFSGTPGSREMIEFGFDPAVDGDSDGFPDDWNNNGDFDDTAPFMILTDDGSGGYEALAENIDAVEFRYLDNTGGPPATPADIRTVQVTLLAKARRPDPKFFNTRIYNTPGGQAWGPYNDNFRRRMLTSSVRCRNL